MARSASTYWWVVAVSSWPEPESDDGDVDAGLEQMHRGRVAQRVGRDPPRRQRWVTLGGLSTGDPQLMLDPGARQGLARAIGEHGGVGGSIDSGEPPPQLRRGALPKRDDTLLASLAVQKQRGRPVEEHVGDMQPGDLGDAGAGVVFAVWAGLAADAVGQGSAATDRAALEAIYRATGGDDWTNNTNWLSSAPLEDWHGVEVTDGRVMGLRLGRGWDESVQKFVGNGLTGSLPPELGTLPRLRRLEIRGNSGLTGPIPAELGSLGNLEFLILQGNRLTGSIPASLGRLTNLKGAWLASNALTGPVPAELGNLVGLRSLALDDNLLSGQVPPELGNLTSLGDLNSATAC